jgi:hypothetical protein
LLFSKQNKSRYLSLGIIVVSVSILKGVIVKPELLPCVLLCQKQDTVAAVVDL